MTIMLTPGLIESTADLQQVLALQAVNLKQNLSATEKDAEGFVTMQFSLDMLERLHAVAPTVVVRDADRIIGYAIVLLTEGRKAYPDLDTMFDHLEALEWRHRPLTSYKYYVMGQICVDKNYRGQQVVKMLYNKHRDLYQQAYDCIVTEISTSNHRSFRAHEKIGF
ncbi:MAG: GNAT family N-acetyltransferase, partial [Moraxellaceae bacterium]